MLPYLSAVTPQIAFTHSVREFIRELLKRFIPGKWIDRVISEDETSFDAKLDAALVGLDEKTATSKDYCAKVVSALCDEVSNICEVTRLVCINRGYRKYAETFLSTEKFVRLQLRQDTEKLERLNAVLEDKTKPLCVLLQEIGAVLENRPTNEVAAFGASELRKANAELKAIAVDVKKTLQTGFKEVNANIKAGVAAVGEKVDAVAAKVTRGKHRCKYDEALIMFCMACVETRSAELRSSTKTKIRLEDIFTYNKRKLAERGVNDAKQFAKIVHAYRARESRRRDKEL